MNLEDRIECMNLVREAELGGASRGAACNLLEVSLRTLQRWEQSPHQGDQRRGPTTAPSNSLTEVEKRMIIEVSSSVEHRDLSPWKIVPKLADLGRYIASESSFYRVLRENNLLAHRGKSKPKRQHRPKDLISRKPNEVWSWDITYLKSPVKGMYYYLYLIVDVFSRLIIDWTIEEVESAELSARLIDRACKKHGILKGKLSLHSDNGAPMKGATMLATLQNLGVMPSFSRPSVSNDNPFSESLFKTLKYRPSFPDGAFAGLDEAKEWMHRFVQWYNTEHLHSGIRFVTPYSRYHGLDKALLLNRRSVYEAAKALNPSRWSRQTRNWSKIEEVYLNPKKDKKGEPEKLRNQAA